MACGGSGSVYDTSYGTTTRAPGPNSSRTGYTAYGSTTNPESPHSYKPWTPESNITGSDTAAAEVILFLLLWWVWLGIQGWRLLFPITLRRFIPLMTLAVVSLFWLTIVPPEWQLCSLSQGVLSACSEQNPNIWLSSAESIRWNELIAKAIFGFGPSFTQDMATVRIGSLIAFSLITVLVMWLWLDYFHDRKRAGYSRKALWSLLVTNRQIPPLFLTLLFTPVAASALLSLVGQSRPFPSDPSFPIHLYAPPLSEFKSGVEAVWNNSPNFLEARRKMLATAQPLVKQPTQLQGGGDIWYVPLESGRGELEVNDIFLRKLKPDGVYTMIVEIKNAVPFIQYDLQVDLGHKYYGAVFSGPTVWHGMTATMPVVLVLKKEAIDLDFLGHGSVTLCDFTINPRRGILTLPRMPFLQPSAILPPYSQAQ